ncbi:hypothetical protein C900_00147 [Fulvivirga imtechensis AK7]|uniref:TraB/GumN family protein n=2 Tax=Fulvivirga TaxID=396811 RepID=L8K0S0_9BACT|nr:hypothetical protein C900_00147 [Fulvivirga imtechensis AK7]
MLCPEDFTMDPVVVNCFASTQQVVMELDIDDPTMMQKMTRLSMNAGGKNISSELTSGQLSQLDGFLIANYGMSMQQLGVMKPFTLYSMIVVKLLRCEQPVSFEMEFLRMSQQAGIEIEGLETVEYQMGVFDSIPATDQIEWIFAALKEKDDREGELAQMIKHYKNKDIDALYSLFIENPEYRKHLDVLLHERNKQWIPAIKEFIHEKPTFIAVGAGHLGSNEGVIAMLEKEGYTLEAVPYGTHANR